jgi:hypothetical protein
MKSPKFLPTLWITNFHFHYNNTKVVRITRFPQRWSCRLWSFGLKMVAACFSKTLESRYKHTPLHNPGKQHRQGIKNCSSDSYEDFYRHFQTLYSHQLVSGSVQQASWQPWHPICPFPLALTQQQTHRPWLSVPCDVGSCLLRREYNF